MDIGASSYRRYLDGDKDAFDQILTEYWDNLVFFLERMVRSTHAAEDLAMDVFADLIVDKHGYNFKVSFKTYLYMLGRSRALNYLKRHRLHPKVPLEDVAQIVDPDPMPEEVLLKKERAAAVENALSQLPPQLREAVYLCYYEDLSCEEAAKVLKKSRKQVYNLLYRGKAALRTILEKEE